MICMCFYGCVLTREYRYSTRGKKKRNDTRCRNRINCVLSRQYAIYNRYMVNNKIKTLRKQKAKQKNVNIIYIMYRVVFLTHNTRFLSKVLTFFDIFLFANNPHLTNLITVFFFFFLMSHDSTFWIGNEFPKSNITIFFTITDVMYLYACSSIVLLVLIRLNNTLILKSIVGDDYTLTYCPYNNFVSLRHRRTKCTRYMYCYRRTISHGTIRTVYIKTVV